MEHIFQAMQQMSIVVSIILSNVTLVNPYVSNLYSYESFDQVTVFMCYAKQFGVTKRVKS